MTISQWSEWFDLISDKVGSAYFSDSEKEMFFNRAIVDYVKELVVASEMKSDRFGEKEGYEKDDMSSYVLQQLSTAKAVSADVNGIISIPAINSEIPGDMLKITLIQTVYNGKNYTARFVRQNDFGKASLNTYLKPRETNPIYRIYTDEIHLYPRTPKTVYISFLRYPRTVSISGNISSDLPDICHNDILKKALAYAGISYRDEFLYAAKSKE